MKETILVIVLTILAGLAVQYKMEMYPFSHRPQHKAAEYFEYWTTANEFEKTGLFKVGVVTKVGKSDYLLTFFYCNPLSLYENTEVEAIWYLDESKKYKFVTFEQLKKDIEEFCKPDSGS